MCVCVCVQVSLLIEHMKQVALSHSDVSVKNRACDAMEHVTLSYPHIIRESILPQLLNLFTLNTRMSVVKIFHIFNPSI